MSIANIFTQKKRINPTAVPVSKQTLTKKAVALVKEVVHDAVSDSDTESYYDDSDNIEKFSPSEEDSQGMSKRDGEPTKRRMAGAVIKVGRRNEQMKDEIKELKKELADQKAQIAKLQKIADSKQASKAEKQKAAAVQKQVEKKVETTAELIEKKETGAESEHSSKD